LVAGFLVEQQVLFRLVGGLFLVYLGVRSFLREPATKPAEINHRGLMSDYASTFLLTLTNPMTIVSFGAVFASFGLGVGAEGHLAALVLIGGIVTGSALWWLILSLGVGLFRARVNITHLGFINKTAGAIISGFGVAALVSVWL
jgi:threonine/homoserine/homoserine lactone efflux protein